MTTSTRSDRPVAIVSGGSGEIGAAIVRGLRSDGLRVAVADIRTDSADEDGFEVDVTDATSCESLRADVIDHFGESASVVVNCAGLMLRGSIEELDLVEAARVHEVNVWGAQRLSRVFVGDMKAAGSGRIINISSIQAWLGLDGYSAYASSKAAINALSRVWARELGPYGITVNSVAPGYVDAVMIEGLFERLAKGRGETPLQARHRLEDEIAIRRLIRPEEIANVVGFLASREASAVNGVSLPVDGGNALM